MFTGIIDEIGTITQINSCGIIVKCSFSNELQLGESVCVNGVCLTVTGKTPQTFSADISPATFNVTALGFKKAGDPVNLERALTVSSRLDGHLVYGHIDTFLKILKITNHGDFCTLLLPLSAQYKNNVVKKGSIALDGVSLTIADIYDDCFDIAIIPHTKAVTALQYLKQNDLVNLEFDIISKYIEKKCTVYDNKSKIDRTFLAEKGFIS